LTPPSDELSRIAIQRRKKRSIDRFKQARQVKLELPFLGT
jgi:hypothetical protein